MSAIGPALPPHLLAKRKRQQEESAASTASTASGANSPPGPQNDHAEEASPKRKRVLGPAMPPAPLEERPSEPASPMPPKTIVEPDGESSSDDDDFGPSLPSLNTDTSASANPRSQTPSPPPASATTKIQRDEWMTMAPTADGLASRMDPSKPRATKFSNSKSARNGGNTGPTDSSAWHETPEQKQKRLKDQAMGVAAKPSNPAAAAAAGKKVESGKSWAGKGLGKDGSGEREESLVERHRRLKGKEAEADDPSKRAFDREKDMAVTGVTGEKGRKELLRRAGDFGGRFEGGKYL